MCVALPGKVIEIQEKTAVVDFNGNQVTARTGLVDIKVGDYVLVHAGCILQKVSKKVYDKINNLNEDGLFIYKPVPAPIDKIKNKYRWRIILKCKLTSRVLDIIKYGIEDSGVKDTSIVVDINPNSMM